MTDTSTAPIAGKVGGSRRTLHRVARSTTLLVAACRPRQWIKNGLVLSAPFAAGHWLMASELQGVAIALVTFVLASSGAYLLNDVADRDRDRLHPVKRLRPVASGALSVTFATRAGIGLLVTAPLLSLLAGELGLTVLLVGYEVLTVLYSRYLKHVPTIEVVVVAIGFLLRPLAGADAADVPPSGWFLAVCAAGALMVALGKREAEMDGCAAHRPALALYSPDRLRAARWTAATVMVGCYIGWALSLDAPHRLASVLSAVALTATTLRYGRLAGRREAGAPERLLLHDRVLQVGGLLWALAFLLGPGSR